MKFGDHPAFPALIVFGLMSFGVLLGFGFNFLIGPNRVMIDKEVDGLVAQISQLHPEDWTISFSGWKEKTLRLDVTVEDENFEFTNRKSISDLYKDVETIKRALNK
jgi:hypothetical protein